MRWRGSGCEVDAASDGNMAAAGGTDNAQGTRQELQRQCGGDFAPCMMGGANNGFWASVQPKDIITILLSGASFVLSVYTLWVAQFSRGRLRMTQPNLLCLKLELRERLPKIFLRTLLFTTGTKGRVVESVFLKVHRGNQVHVFDFWGHTESGKLTPGSGLFVGPAGVGCDHHFNPRKGGCKFRFEAGRYRVEVFAVVVGHSRSKKLSDLTFDVEERHAVELAQGPDTALYLLWNVDARSYEAQIDSRLAGNRFP